MCVFIVTTLSRIFVLVALFPKAKIYGSFQKAGYRFAEAGLAGDADWKAREDEALNSFTGYQKCQHECSKS